MQIFNKRLITTLLIILLILGTTSNIVRGEDHSGNMEKEILKLKANFKLEKGKFTGIGKDKNLIVLQIDSLQNFLVNMEYNEQQILPNINKLVMSKESIYYDNYHELTGLGDGVDAEFVSNNSFYPYLGGAAYEEYENTEFYSLGASLEDQEYKTSLITDDPGSLWNRESNYKRQGFQDFYSREDFQLEKDNGFLLESGEILNSSLEKITNNLEEEEKFFSYITTSIRDKSSIDINPNGEFEILERDKSNKLVEYFSMMNDLDARIGLLVEELKEKDLYRDTTLVIQGGSSGIPMANWAEQDYLEELIGQEYEYSQMMNIPLLVHIPGFEKGEKISTLGSHLDFYPTIKNIIGYNSEKSLGFGKDLSNTKGYRSISLGRHKPKGSFYDGENVLLLSRFEEFYMSKAYRVNSNGEVPLDYLEGIYLNLRDEMDLSDKILRNNLIREVKEVKDTTYENYLVQNSGHINDIRRLNNMGYSNFIIKPEDNINFISDIENINLIYQINRKNLKTLGDKRLISDYAIIQDESLYAELKALGFNNIILDARELEEEIKNEYKITILDKKDLDKKVGSDKIYLDKEDIEISKNFKDYQVDGYLTSSNIIFAFDKAKQLKNKHIIAHAGGELKNRTYTNSLDSVKNSYENGIRLMELDFEWTTDDKLVATHSWDGFINSFFGVPVDRYSYEEFINFNMINDWQQFYPDLLEDWTNIYSDTFIVTDIKDRNIEALSKLLEKNPYMVNKLIPQVYNFEEYLAAEQLGFDNIILTLYLIDANNEEIVEFGKSHKPFAITMPIWRVGTGLGNSLKNEGIFTYTHTVNDIDLIEGLESKGIMGIYTDRIQP